MYFSTRYLHLFEAVHAHDIDLLRGPDGLTTAGAVHEMVHYYCQINNIQDTSRGNTYHNKRFKEEAE